MNFFHLVHPEDMSPKSMSTKEVSEALPAHGFGVPDLYPERVYEVQIHGNLSCRVFDGIEPTT